MRLSIVNEVLRQLGQPTVSSLQEEGTNSSSFLDEIGRAYPINLKELLEQNTLRASSGSVQLEGTKVENQNSPNDQYYRFELPHDLLVINEVRFTDYDYTVTPDIYFRSFYSGSNYAYSRRTYFLEGRLFYAASPEIWLFYTKYTDDLKLASFDKAVGARIALNICESVGVGDEKLKARLDTLVRVTTHRLLTLDAHQSETDTTQESYWADDYSQLGNSGGPGRAR